MRPTTVTLATCTAVSTSDPLDLRALARAAGAEPGWVLELVEVGIVAPAGPDIADEWRFDSEALSQALQARRLQRDFGVGLEAAALILDLQREVRRLKSLAIAHGWAPRA